MRSVESVSSPKPSKLVNATVWVAQILIFSGFVIIGWMKLVKPIPELAAMWAWTGQLPENVVRGLGIIDIAGGVGVFLPAITRIKPKLTVLAALGCVALQISAVIFHTARGEVAVTPINVVFLALSALILWGRRKLPISPR